MRLVYLLLLALEPELIHAALLPLLLQFGYAKVSQLQVCVHLTSLLLKFILHVVGELTISDFLLILLPIDHHLIMSMQHRFLMLHGLCQIVLEKLALVLHLVRQHH